MQCFYCFTCFSLILIIRVFVLYGSHVPMDLFRKSPRFIYYFCEMGDEVQSLGSQPGISQAIVYFYLQLNTLC